MLTLLSIRKAGVRAILIIFLVIAGFAANAQANLETYLSTSKKAGPWQDEKSRLQSFMQKLGPTSADEQKHLRRTFRRVHNEFLKKYSSYADFDETITSGRYDCLTATVLFTHVLKELGYTYDIIETNYHIFLMVYTDEGRVLLETTDRFGGLVRDENRIAEKLAAYKENLPSADISRPSYQFTFRLFQTITEEKLAGLLYFNQAVKAYNSRNWLESALSLERAAAMYGSERCEELGAILLQTVLEARIDDKTKADCLRHLGNYWSKRSQIFAAN